MSDNKPQSVLLLVGGLVVAGLAGCLAYLLLHPMAPFPPLPKSEQSLVSPAVDIDVYVDGSESIWHFLNNSRGGSTGVSSGRTNYLRQFLNHLETTLTPKIRAWKFGEYGGVGGKKGAAAALPLEGGPGKLTEAPEREFNAGRTPIEVAVTDEPRRVIPAEVRMIVTDLYQSDYRVGDYEKPLVEKYLADDAHAVEVFAIRNPFDGEVEDLPGAGQRTLHHAADTMPFYVIAAGLTPDVLRVREALLSDADDGIVEALREHRGIEMLFAKDPGTGQQPAPLIEVPGRRGAGTTSSGEQWEAKGNDHKASYVVVGERAGVTQVTVRQSGRFRVSWALRAVDSSPGHVDTVGRSNLLLSVHAYVSGGKSRNPSQKQPSATQEVPEAAAAVTLSCTAERAFPCAVLDKSRLASGRYLFRFDVLASKPAAVFESRSPLMQDWSIEKDSAEAIAASGRPFSSVGALAPSSAHPGMTPQLAEFLHALQAAVFDSPVRLVSYYLYVEAK